jgi:hypothetical protein
MQTTECKNIRAFSKEEAMNLLGQVVRYRQSGKLALVSEVGVTHTQPRRYHLFIYECESKIRHCCSKPCFIRDFDII